MRLFCVKEASQSEWSDGTPAMTYERVIVGNEYESYRDKVYDDGLYYFLEGFPGNVAFHHSLFATLPPQSADEINEEEREAILM